MGRVVGKTRGIPRSFIVSLLPLCLAFDPLTPPFVPDVLFISPHFTRGESVSTKGIRSFREHVYLLRYPLTD